MLLKEPVQGTRVPSPYCSPAEHPRLLSPTGRPPCPENEGLALWPVGIQLSQSTPVTTDDPGRGVLVFPMLNLIRGCCWEMPWSTPNISMTLKALQVICLTHGCKGSRQRKPGQLWLKPWLQEPQALGMRSLHRTLSRGTRHSCSVNARQSHRGVCIS